MDPAQYTKYTNMFVDFKTFYLSLSVCWTESPLVDLPMKCPKFPYIYIKKKQGLSCLLWRHKLATVHLDLQQV